MHIDWWTLALQAINFLILVWLLSRFLYRPVKAVIEKRKELSDQAFAEADRMRAEADAARQRFEDDRAGLAKEREDMLRTLHEDMDAERGKMLEGAKAEADKLLTEAKARVAEERAAALEEIQAHVASLAAEMAAGLLRQTGAGPNGVFLDRLAERLSDLPAEERERLTKDLASDGARLTVVTASPLSDAEQGEWRARLKASLDQTDKTDFLTAPEILGGAELRFPHAVLKLTWADQLEQARQALERPDAAS